MAKFIVFIKRGQSQLRTFANRGGTLTLDKKVEKLIVVTTIIQETRVILPGYLFGPLAGVGAGKNFDPGLDTISAPSPGRKL